MDEEPPSPSMSSAPPEAEGEAVSHAALANHPLWARARGDGPPDDAGGRGNRGGRGGRGRGRPGSEHGDAFEQPALERISLAAQEQELYQNGDGADSVAWSDDEERPARKKPKARRPESPGSRPRKERRQSAPKRFKHEDDEAASAGGDDETDGDGDGDGGSRARLAQMMGAAAFGGEYAPSDDGLSASERSEASSKLQREAAKRAFPIRGTDCVGCVLNNRISAVDRFIRANIAKMTEDSLWKMAALTYKKDVVEPAAAEGTPVPAWGWKAVRNHYELHSMSNLIQRHKQLRTLQCMRTQLDASLVRNENGRRELDRANTTLMLNVIKEESKLRDTLEASINGEKKRGA